MNTVQRLLTNICSDQLQESKDFYTSLFDFKVDFDSDWFVHLISKGKQLELGIILSSSDIVPPEARGVAQGHYLTFVVDDVDKVFRQAEEHGYSILSIPEDTFYGQRRLLLKDPNGVVVDVSAPIPGFSFG